MTSFPYTSIDLTHTLNKNSPSWTGGCGFEHEIKLDYADCKTEVKFRVQQLKMHAGIGTHMDAPAHVVEDGKSIEQLSLEHLICPCVCIDVSEMADKDYLVSVDDIQGFEKRHGTIQTNSFVIVYTGWDKHWDDPKKYHNQYQFPSISEAAILHLLERQIAGVGIDTLSPDLPTSGFPVHKHLLGAGKYIVENVAHAKQLPPKGSFSLALPIKGQGLTEAPVRLVGLIPK